MYINVRNVEPFKSISSVYKSPKKIPCERGHTVDSTNPWPTENVSDENNNAQENAQRHHSIGIFPAPSPLAARKLIEATETVEVESTTEIPVEVIETVKTPCVTQNNSIDGADTIDALPTEVLDSTKPGDIFSIEAQATQKFEQVHLPKIWIEGSSTSSTSSAGGAAQSPFRAAHPQKMTRGWAVLLAALLFTLVLRATSIGPTQFLGSQGWASALSGSASSGDSSLLKHLVPSAQLTSGTANAKLLIAQRYIDLIVQKMTLDQKLGQMMIVQFLGPSYSLELSTMVNRYNAGAVLLSAANNNIVDKTQLKDLIQQMQSNSPIPLAVATDQEGGVVDRLAALDGPRPSAATIGATNDPNQAMAAGVKDAQDLSSYGINLNLAPVVDVTNVYNPQLYTRTYGNNVALVTKMAAAYLQGLQQSGRVLGTLKHFPGLGDVGVDPHSGVPVLPRSRNELESIDWAPYRTLIQQGNVHAIMVTHELVTALDATRPSSLSPKIVKAILRDELKFQGVIITDSLTMEGITAYYNEAQAAASAVEAGSDLLMGAGTANDVATMTEGIKQAMDAGDIAQQEIDDSVRRILMMKYAMGLLAIPTR